VSPAVLGESPLAEDHVGVVVLQCVRARTPSGRIQLRNRSGDRHPTIAQLARVDQHPAPFLRLAPANGPGFTNHASHRGRDHLLHSIPRHVPCHCDQGKVATCSTPSKKEGRVAPPLSSVCALDDRTVDASEIWFFSAGRGRGQSRHHLLAVVGVLSPRSSRSVRGEESGLTSSPIGVQRVSLDLARLETRVIRRPRTVIAAAGTKREGLWFGEPKTRQSVENRRKSEKKAGSWIRATNGI